MAVPLKKRCFFHRCRSTGLYRFTLSRDVGPLLRDWLACLEHRDLIEAALGSLGIGVPVHINHKPRPDTEKKSTVIAPLAGGQREDQKE